MCRKSAGCCRKSAAITENLQKICRYCRKSAAITENVQIFCTFSVSFKIISSWCQLKSHVTSNSLPEKAIRVIILFKHDVEGKVFDSNCVEMGVEVIEMD